MAARSTYRPRDWSPLASGDPVPGDPAEILEEVQHMKDLARSLRDQAHDLQIIGHGEGLKGKYAEKLREKANTLEKHLRQTAERYEHVHGHLSNWAGELEGFQADSVRILHQAQAAEAHDKAKASQQQAAGHPAPTSKAGSGSHDDPVQPYTQQLNRLTQHRDERGAYYAGKINAACNDAIKDSTWEHIEDVVGDVLNNKWVKLFFEIASWVCTVVGILALFLTPVGWLVTLCTALAVLTLAKDLLAAATGNGNWIDVAMDTVGCLGIFGAGKALKALAELRSATKVAAEGAAAEEASAQALRNSRNALNRTYAVTSRRGSSSAAKAAARAARSAIKAEARQAGEAARQAEHATPMAEATKLEALAYGGDTEVASNVADINRMRSGYSDSSAVLDASKHVTALSTAAKVAWGVPTGTDAVDKIFGKSDELMPQKPYSQSYGDFKDRFTGTFGSSW